MRKIFTKSSNQQEIKIYTDDYGTQTIILPPQSEPNSLDKSDSTSFTMDKNDNILTLTSKSKYASIYWPEFSSNDNGEFIGSDKVMAINNSTGILTVDYQSEKRDNTVIYFGCADSATFDFRDLSELEIRNPGTVFMFIDYITSDKPPTLTMSGKSKFRITQPMDIQQDSPAFIFLASSISLKESSELTFESSELFLGDGKFNYCNINIQDNSQLILNNDGILPKSDIDRSKTQFNLGTGSPLLKISSITGISSPLSLDNIEYPECLFNFITTKGDNKGKIIIDVINDPKFSDKIFSKKLIAINGKIADKENFSVSYGTETRQGNSVTTTKISLKL
ncbi:MULTISPECIES: hypothetical protein [Photorhabdus]|uniref:Uncharacterized protein n=2 Tax=Photorhabdus asymbiotica TaxID=291112 RepID=B6VK62_PHOAA|nr:hypothetical protein [Photorhabdus asymbiotica]RKS66913.1 hypothetical protein BDD30_1261 [Photorhabdus asymbiotica]CAQ83116.1 conserved hypothetical protein [Photorhabdus asymbiotica]CAR66542.1 Conserved Hypothetical Protein [Photorhabdus asymbiotica subsp. asymbiotica ATCC 43949]